MFITCIRYNIRIKIEWVPREMNQLADYYSRVVDYDEWYINPTIFAMVDEWWGPHSIDRFATSYNKQVERFNSCYACPGTEAKDTFTVNWSGENNWWCPPSALIPRVIRHTECCNKGQQLSRTGNLPHFGLCCVPVVMSGPHLWWAKGCYRCQKN